MITACFIFFFVSARSGGILLIVRSDFSTHHMHYESHSNLAEALNNTLPRLLYIILVCCVQSDAVILTLYRAVFCVGGGGGGEGGGEAILPASTLF